MDIKEKKQHPCPVLIWAINKSQSVSQALKCLNQQLPNEKNSALRKNYDITHLSPKKFENAISLWKRNNHRSFWICVWGKLGQGSYYDYRNVIFFEKLSFQNVFRPH